MPREHRVTFMSPGTFFSEATTQVIPSWDVAEACQRARNVVERYNARPYGFRFSTWLTHPPVPDGEGGELKVESRRVGESGLHFLGGEVKRYADIADTEANVILRTNLRGNDWPLLVEGKSPYLWSIPFRDDDVVVHPDTAVIYRRVCDPDLAAYAAEQRAAWQRERDLRAKAKTTNFTEGT